VVIGDRYGTSCAPLLPTWSRRHGPARLFGRTQQAYAGGFITEHYGNPASGTAHHPARTHRAIYMDERRAKRGPRFAQVVTDFAKLADALAAMPLGDSDRFRPRRSSCRFHPSCRSALLAVSNMLIRAPLLATGPE